MRIKVLFLAHETRLNGATKSLLNIIDNLPNEIEAIVIIPRQDGPLVEELNKRSCGKLYVKYYSCVFKQLTFNKNIESYLKYYLYRSYVNRKAAKIVLSFVKKNQINIIHTNSGVLDIGARVKKMYKDIVHIWHIREFLEEDQGLIPVYGWKAYYDNMNNNVNCIIAVSKAVAGKFGKFVNQKLIKVIYNGVAKDNIVNRNRKNNSSLHLLQTGAVNPYKGVGTSIKALKYLLENGYSDIELYIAGEGNLDFCRDDFEAVKSKVHLLGYVNNIADVRSCEIDAEIVCSRCEAFGRVTVEAMLAGLPVIGSNTGGTVELIKDGVNGYLFECNDYIDLASKIILLYSDKLKCRDLGNTAKVYASENFLIDRCVEDIVRVYYEMIEKRDKVVSNETGEC